MAHFPLALLSDLASRDIQIGHIGDSTDLEELLGDLLCDARKFRELAQTTDVPSSARQREAIREFCASLDALEANLDHYDQSNIADLFESDPRWQMMRERAADVLKAFEPLR